MILLYPIVSTLPRDYFPVDSFSNQPGYLMSDYLFRPNEASSSRHVWRTRMLYFLLILPLPLLLTTCSLNRLAINQSIDLLKQSRPALERETDLELAEAAIAGNLKLLEGMLEIAPDNQELLLMTAQAFSAYTLAFVEPRIQQAEFDAEYGEKERQKDRATDFYSRSRGYALRALHLENRALAEVLENGKPDAIRVALKKAGEKELPGLFWLGNAWAAQIIFQIALPERSMEIPIVAEIMQRVLEMDEAYNSAGPHLFFGAYYGARPRMLGGDVQKAREHFDRAIELTGGEVLFAKLMKARYYAIPAREKETCQAILQEVIDTPADKYPVHGFVNALARRDAQILMDNIDEFFF